MNYHMTQRLLIAAIKLKAGKFPVLTDELLAVAEFMATNTIDLLPGSDEEKKLRILKGYSQNFGKYLQDKGSYEKAMEERTKIANLLQEEVPVTPSEAFVNPEELPVVVTEVAGYVPEDEPSSRFAFKKEVDGHTFAVGTVREFIEMEERLHNVWGKDTPALVEIEGPFGILYYSFDGNVGHTPQGDKLAVSKRMYLEYKGLLEQNEKLVPVEDFFHIEESVFERIIRRLENLGIITDNALKSEETSEIPDTAESYRLFRTKIYRPGKLGKQRLAFFHPKLKALEPGEVDPESLSEAASRYSSGWAAVWLDTD